MLISFDPPKNATNVQECGLPFELVENLDWSTALMVEDKRKDYGERRFQATGFIGDRLHVVIFTPRAGKVHVISLRKANLREIKKHAKTTKP
jgi:uncharacterized protein